MDTEPLHDNVACAGYGAIVVMIRVLRGQLDILSARIRQGDYTSIGVLEATADSMIAAIESIGSTPTWDDARTQMLALIREYRDLITHTQSRDAAVILPAVAEVLEALAILAIARDRLGGRLGLGPRGG